MTRKRGLGYEDMMHKQFGGLMRQYEHYKKLKCVYWSYDASGEARSRTTASLLKVKGLNGGKGDYLFIKQYAALVKPDKVDYFIWLEFKKPKTTTVKGKQSDSQKEFENKFKNSINSRYYVVYSIEEAIKILEKEGIL